MKNVIDRVKVYGLNTYVSQSRINNGIARAKGRSFGLHKKRIAVEFARIDNPPHLPSFVVLPSPVCIASQFSSNSFHLQIFIVLPVTTVI